MSYLDSGFYIIGVADALKLADNQLPRPGYEQLVVHEGKHYWLGRTRDQGRQVWTIRDAWKWRLVNGIATSR